MSEYRFTGPFYNDGEDYGYGRDGSPAAPVDFVPEEVPVVKSNPFAEAASTAEETPIAEENPFVEETPFAEKIPTGAGTLEFEESEEDSEKQMEELFEQFQKTKRKSVAKKLGLALLTGAVAGATFLGVVSAGFHMFGIGKTTPTVAEIQKGTNPQVVSGEVKNSIDVSVIAQQCMPSVVSITNKGVQEIRSWFGTYQQEISGSGSGIIIGENSTELLIVTNYHVVADTKELSVYFSFDEKEEEPTVVKAKIKGYDSQKDLAVISVQLDEIPAEAKSQIAIATIGNSSELKVGEQVVAIGNALGYGQSVTTGIISALNRDVTVEGASGEAITNKLIQTDAAINPGNSGGALINMRGEVIGINSVKFASAEVEGMGYAIPITDVELIIGDLMNKVTRDKVNQKDAGYLGIQCVDVSAEVAQMYDLPVGVYVKAVVDGSAAAQAGIKSGDVIVKLDGSTVVTNTELREALSYYRSGETIEVVVKTRDSGYEEQTFQVTLSSAADAGIE